VNADRHGSTIEDAYAYRIHRTNRLLSTHLARFLAGRSSELTPEKFFILMKLHEAGPLPQNALIDVTLGDGPNVSRLVERLVVSGLVERAEDPNDRRARVLELTAEGSALARRLADDVVDERRVVFAGVSEHDLDTLGAVLDRLDANLRPSLDVESGR